MEQWTCPDCGGPSTMVGEFEGETLWHCEACLGYGTPVEYERICAAESITSTPGIAVGEEEAPGPSPHPQTEDAPGPESRPRPRNTGLPSRTHELGTLSLADPSARYAHLGGPKPPRPAPPPILPPRPAPPPILPPRPVPPPVASGWTLGRGLAVLAVIAALVWGISSCHAYGPRTGAVCRDGTYSSATGSGACSHHGGVDHWITK